MTDEQILQIFRYLFVLSIGSGIGVGFAIWWLRAAR